MQFRSLINLTRSQLEDFCKVLPFTGDPAQYPDRHASFRYKVRGVNVLLKQPSGDYSAFSVYPTTISRRGLGFLHGGFIHNESTCTFFLSSVTGNIDRVKAVIVRCCHLQGTLHEVGAAFVDPIDIRHYLASDDSGEDANKSD